MSWPADYHTQPPNTGPDHVGPILLAVCLCVGWILFFGLLAYVLWGAAQ